MVAAPCRDASDSAGSSPVPEEGEEEEEEEGEEEGSPEGNDTEGTVTWQQAPTKKGQKNKNKSKGEPEGLHTESG